MADNFRTLKLNARVKEVSWKGGRVIDVGCVHASLLELSEWLNSPIVDDGGELSIFISHQRVGVIMFYQTLPELELDVSLKDLPYTTPPSELWAPTPIWAGVQSDYLAINDFLSIVFRKRFKFQLIEESGFVEN